MKFVSYFQPAIEIELKTEKSLYRGRECKDLTIETFKKINATIDNFLEKYDTLETYPLVKESSKPVIPACFLCTKEEQDIIAFDFVRNKNVRSDCRGIDLCYRAFRFLVIPEYNPEYFAL